MNERIKIVNSNNDEIGGKSRQKAWEEGLYSQIVRVILTDERGRILLQLRSPSKSLYPNRWTDSATGHVNSGEDAYDAAHRELREELGVDTELQPVGRFSMKDNSGGNKIRSINIVYFGRVQSSLKFDTDDDEVARVAWKDQDQLKNEFRENPHKFTPGLIHVIHTFFPDSEPR